jgi:hypothetical protein
LCGEPIRIDAYQDQFFLTELFFVTTLKKEFQNKVFGSVVGRANKRVKRIAVGREKGKKKVKKRKEKKIEVGAKRSNRKKKLKKG